MSSIFSSSGSSRPLSWGGRLGLVLALACLCVAPLWRHMVYLQPEAFAIHEFDVNNVPEWLQSNMVVRHKLLLAGKSILFNPWQYRILSAWMAEGFVMLWKQLPVTEPYKWAFASFRLLQHLVIYLLAWRYYRQFVMSPALIWLGFAAMAWSMSLSVLWSDLSFNTYNDIIFYLLGLLLVLEQRPVSWLLPLMVAATLNRETIALLPFTGLCLAINWQQLPAARNLAGLRAAVSNRELAIGCLLAGVVFVAVTAALRLHYGWAPAMSYTWDEVWFQTIRDFRIRAYDRNQWTDHNTYYNLLGTLGILPLLNLVFFRQVRGRLRIIWLALVPLWFMGHLLLVPLRETRLFLVPMVVCFIPALLQIIEAQLLPRPQPATADLA